MLNRWIETEGLVDVAQEEGFGIIGFTALAQGLLTGRYLDGVPQGSRATQGKSFDTAWLTDDMLHRLRALNDIAARRGQTLAQMALAWALRDRRVTSLVIGASRTEQLEQNVAALDNLDFSGEELAEIDKYATDGGVDLWREARLGNLGLSRGVCTAAEGEPRRGGPRSAATVAPALGTARCRRFCPTPASTSRRRYSTGAGSASSGWRRSRSCAASSCPATGGAGTRRFACGPVRGGAGALRPRDLPGLARPGAPGRLRRHARRRSGHRPARRTGARSAGTDRGG
ncbi:hypothetical protein SHIRM173S_08781 [Streptomyces hirsutus]